MQKMANWKVCEALDLFKIIIVGICYVAVGLASYPGTGRAWVRGYSGLAQKLKKELSQKIKRNNNYCW